jgi:outer membrane biosynthesis protein TonB
MAGMRSGDSEEKNLDWESLQGPVPMDFIDPEFPAHPTETMPGAASEILPREESEALARETGAGIGADAAAETLFAPPAFAPDPSAIDPRATIVGGTWFGGNQAVQDDFARIRAEMEAENEAEKSRKLEAEQEEAAQRARLEQWMANARARLLKADADLTGPSGRVRLRKESSPSLYRMAEMQKTMDLSGEATVADGTRSLLAPAAPDPMATISVPADTFLKTDPATTNGPAMGFPPLRPFPAGNPADVSSAVPDAPPVDPTLPAFPIHPFVRPAPSSNNPPTTKFPAQPIPQAPAAFSVPTVISGPQGWPMRDEAAAPSGSLERSLAFPPEPGNPESDEASPFQPMSREEALTRKVAKLRMAAETGDNTLVRSPLLDEESDGRALNFAIAAMVLVAILVLGLGLFAATQAGLFDGMENRIPFLKPKVAMGGLSGPDGRTGGDATAPAPSAPPTSVAPPSQDIVEAPPLRPSASTAPLAAPTSPAAPAASSAPAASAPEARMSPKPVSAVPAQAAPSAPTRLTDAALRNSPVTSRPARAPARSGQTAPAPGSKSAARARKGQAQSFPPAVPEEEMPAYARPRASGAAQTEILLRNAVEAAANREKDDLRELYNRYALGFPGLSGEVMVGLTVDPSGRILEATVVSSTTGVTTFDQDLVRKVVLWRLRSFPETRPKFISVPFLFPMQGH